MNVRQRRLKADYDKLCTLFTQNAKIRIKKTLGDPPEKYQFEYLVTGLEKRLDGSLQLRNNFLVEVVLTGAYPRLAPQCKMLTPVYHPNIAPHAICIGDHWAAGEMLANLVIRIAEMLSFQSYNLKSPLNGDAAKWVEENKDKLPLDLYDFASLLSIGEAVGRAADGTLIAGAVCANCGKHGEPGEMQVCVNQHAACPSCLLRCPICAAVLCLKCPMENCAICKTAVCQKCLHKCGTCGHVVCSNHHFLCHVCKRGRCDDCLVTCALCRKPACVEHIKKRRSGDAEPQFICDDCYAAGSVNAGVPE